MAYRLSSIYKSLIRHVRDMIDDIRDSGVSPGLKYYAFDSRGEEAEVENDDLVGLAGWTFDENRGLWLIRCGINVSTIFDRNLLREIEIVDKIHDWFGEDQIVPLRDPDTGEEYTQLVVKHFEMAPTLQSEKRNYRPVSLELLRTSTDG